MSTPEDKPNNTEIASPETVSKSETVAVEKRSPYDLKRTLQTFRLGDMYFQVNYTALFAGRKMLQELLDSESDLAGIEGFVDEVFVSLATSKSSIITPIKKSDSHSVLPSIRPISNNLKYTEKTWLDVIKIVPGLIVLVGDTAAGKSTFLDQVEGPDVIIRLAEPFERFEFGTRSENSLYGVSISGASVEHALASALLIAVSGYSVSIDGLRSLIYDLGGAAMSGGMSASLFDAITTLNNLFAAVDAHAVASVNPMMKDYEDTMRLYHRLAASCAAAVYFDKSHNAEASWRSFDGRSTGVSLTDIIEAKKNKIERMPEQPWEVTPSFGEDRNPVVEAEKALDSISGLESDDASPKRDVRKPRAFPTNLDY